MSQLGYNWQCLNFAIYKAIRYETLSHKRYTCLHIVAFVVLHGSDKMECSLSCKLGVDGHYRSFS